MKLTPAKLERLRQKLVGGHTWSRREALDVLAHVDETARELAERQESEADALAAIQRARLNAPRPLGFEIPPLFPMPRREPPTTGTELIDWPGDMKPRKP